MNHLAKSTRIPIAIAVLLLLAGSQATAQTKPPTADSSPIAYEVRWFGQLKNVKMKGDLSGTIDLEALAKLPHVYAVGALEGLQGEVTILDGIASISRIKDGKVVVDDLARGKACVLVYAQVKQWKELPLPKNVQSLGDLETAIVEAARKNGINVDRPFPFLVKGIASGANYHVLRYPGKLDDPHEQHAKAQVKFNLKDAAVELVGFYSNKHLGIFTCGGNLHVHMRSSNGTVSGHLDDVALAEGTRLYLPVVSAK